MSSCMDECPVEDECQDAFKLISNYVHLERRMNGVRHLGVTKYDIDDLVA